MLNLIKEIFQLFIYLITNKFKINIGINTYDDQYIIENNIEHEYKLQEFKGE